MSTATLQGHPRATIWDEHAAFIDGLVDEGFIHCVAYWSMKAGAMVVVRADDEEAVRARMVSDPWYREQILELVSIKRWEIFIDRRV